MAFGTGELPPRLPIARVPRQWTDWSDRPWRAVHTEPGDVDAVGGSSLPVVRALDLRPTKVTIVINW